MPYDASSSQKASDTVPFTSAEEAWFWFIDAQDAKSSGARIVAGQGLYPRPCETVDILKILDRLYRSHLLMRDHLLVLRHYGRRKMPPDSERVKEVRAYRLWHEALDAMEDVLVQKGIVERPHSSPSGLWREHAVLMENLNSSTGHQQYE